MPSSALRKSVTALLPSVESLFFCEFGGFLPDIGIANLAAIGMFNAAQQRGWRGRAGVFVLVCRCRGVWGSKSRARPAGRNIYVRGVADGPAVSPSSSTVNVVASARGERAGAEKSEQPG